MCATEFPTVVVTEESILGCPLMYQYHWMSPRFGGSLFHVHACGEGLEFVASS